MKRKEQVGVVVSDRMDKTRSVQVERRFPHPLYGKVMTRKKRYLAHDEQGAAHRGDTVRIVEGRPVSRWKRWRVVEIISRAQTSAGAVEGTR